MLLKISILSVFSYASSLTIPSTIYTVSLSKK